MSLERAADAASPSITGTQAEDAAPATHLDIGEPTHRGDVVAAALCLASGLIGYFIVIPAEVYVPSNFVGTANSPAFLPKIVCILLSVLSAIYLVKSVAALRREGVQLRSRPADWLLALGMIGICVAYVTGIYVLGMSVASGLCVAGALYYFGERRIPVIAGIAVILPAFLWYFFVKIANILMPVPVLDIVGDAAAFVLGAGGLA